MGFALPIVGPPLQLRYSTCYSSVTASVTAPLQLHYSSVAPPLQLRYSFHYSSVVQLRYRSVIGLLLLLRLRYSFRNSIATAGSAPLQPSDTAPLQLRDESVTAPSFPLQFLLQAPLPASISVIVELQMMVEPRPNSKFEVPAYKPSSHKLRDKPPYEL